ncbi:MAG: hypothetical protein ACOYXC_16170 [Candidatus Rifleibacteriota bacterium]
MAIAANFISHRFMRASRFSEAIDTLFKKEEKEPVKPRSSLEKDLIELSPFNQIRQTIAQFQRETSLEAELNVSLTARSAQIGEGAELEPEIDRDLDLMLRMISKDEEEYKSLRSRFEKLLKQAKSDFSSEPPSDAATPSIAVSTQTSASQTFEIAMKFRKQVDSSERIGISLEELGIKEADPLVLDIAGDGIDLTRAGEGAIFDIDADGKLDQTAWVRGDDALLVLDRNENGKIDDGSELFGDQNGAANGFIELAKHDNNKDGRIDRLDPVFKALKLYQDINGNGKVESQELFSLQQLGIKALNLNFFQTNQKINGNSLILNGSFERENGTSGQLADVLLGFRKI